MREVADIDPVCRDEGLWFSTFSMCPHCWSRVGSDDLGWLFVRTVGNT
jgi:hypothetical protein